MRLLTGDHNLAYRPIPKPDAVNPLIVDDTKGRHLIKFQEDQETLWQEYELQEAVDACGFTVIEQVVDAQYIAERRKEYVGYNNKTVHSLLAHVWTWAIIANRQNIEAKDCLHALWRTPPPN